MRTVFLNVFYFQENYKNITEKSLINIGVSHFYFQKLLHYVLVLSSEESEQMGCQSILLRNKLSIKLMRKTKVFLLRNRNEARN